MILKFQNIFVLLRSEYHKIKDLSWIKKYIYIYIQLHECHVNKSSWMAISTHTHTKHTHKQNISPTFGHYLVIYTTQYFPNHSPVDINIDYINNQVTIYPLYFSPNPKRFCNNIRKMIMHTKAGYSQGYWLSSAPRW